MLLVGGASLGGDFGAVEYPSGRLQGRWPSGQRLKINFYVHSEEDTVDL